MADWTIGLALQYLRPLQVKTMDEGWCLLLGGGVLNKGFGPDLDILAYPRTKESKTKNLLKCLPKRGKWSDVPGVSRIYRYKVEGRVVELIFLIMSAITDGE